MASSSTSTFLEVLYDGSEQNPSESVDLVAVHGLNPLNTAGHAHKTWTHDTTNKLWLKDFLPNSLPHARVMLFGYNANVAFSTAQAGLREHADGFLDRLRRKRNECEQRPIIFIGHSLGGLLIKQVLAKARTTDKYLPILKAAYGIVFFGTPHHGGEGVGFGTFVSSVARAFLRSPSNSLLKSLKKESTFADILNEDFANQYENYRIISFYETLPLKKAKRIIVPKRSAVLGLSAEREASLPVAADHSDVCKFANASGEDYEPVEGNLVELVEGAVKSFKESQIQETSTSSSIPNPTRHFIVPQSKVSYFTGRDDLLELLNKKLPASKGRQWEPRVVPIWGMGGAGKTQLVLQYISTHRQNYDHVFWVDATDNSTLLQAIERIIVDNLGRESCLVDKSDPGYYDKVIEVVKRWLEVFDCGRWLFVFDNADNKEIFPSIQRFMPHSGQGDVILTSRLRESCDFGLPNAIEVKEMQQTEALSLLFTRAGHKRRSEDFENIGSNDTALKIVETLGSLPLALDLAGAYICRNSITFDRYLCLYNETFGQEQLTDYKPVVWSYEKTVLTTWDMSFGAVKKESPHAAELFLLFGYLHHENISLEVFRRASETRRYGLFRATNQEEKVAMGLLEEIMTTNSEGEWQTQIFTDAIGTLLSYSLLRNRVYGNSYDIHALVHLWSYKYSLAHKQTWRIRLTLHLLANAVQEQEGAPDHEFLREVIPHLDKISHEFRDWQEVNKAHYSPLILSVATAYRQTGRLKKAFDIQTQILVATKKVLGADHPGTLISMGNLASTYYSQGRLKEAEDLQVQVLAARKKVLGADHPGTLISMGSLALTYSSQGRLKEAEDLGVQVLAARKKVLGADHPGTLTSMGNLASTYFSQGRFKEAEDLEVQVLAAMKKVLGEDHPDTLISMGSLASTYYSQGRLKEAEDLEVQVLAARKKVVGADHPGTLGSMGNLASTYFSQGRLKEAEDLQVQVLAAMKKVLGADHPGTLISMGNLASTYSSQGRLKEAEDLRVQVLAAMKKVLGADHPNTLTSMNNLALAYFSQGRFKEAEDLGVQVLAARKKVLGADHPGTLILMGSLASTYSSQGRLKEAEDLGVQVLAATKKVLGEDHPNTLISMGSLASTYSSQGRLKEAEDLEVQVLAARKKVLGADHPNTLTSMNNLALTYYSQGRLKEAEDLGVQVLAAMKKVLGEDHLDTLTSMGNLALTYFSQGRLKEAEDLEVQVLAGRKVLGADHPNTLISMQNLAMTQKRLKAGEARRYHMSFRGARRLLDRLTHDPK